MNPSANSSESEVLVAACPSPSAGEPPDRLHARPTVPLIAPAVRTLTEQDLEHITADPPPWERRAVLHQRWSELAYFHWRYEPAAVQRLLPAGVRVDTFDGDAWVGLIPFEMRDVRLGPTPPVPLLGRFIEVNVRTYVTDGRGRRAVWFFSLDVPRSAVVAVARSVFGLPYCWANADHVVGGDRHRYSVERRWPHRARPTADIRWRVGSPVAEHETSALDDFLFARWALMVERRRQLWLGRVHHLRWPLHSVEDVVIDESLVAAAGLPRPVGSPHARYSPGVDVRIAWYERIPTTG